jgi:hypothetical protein
MRFLTLLLSISLLACSESKDNTQSTSPVQQETEKVAEAKKELKDSLSIFKAQYVKLYERQLANSANDSIRSDLQAFHAAFLNTVGFIDSVWAFVDTLDYHTESNILLMRSKFMEEGLGDTLYQKMDLVFKHAKQLAPQSTYPFIEAQHTAVFNNQDAESWKKQYFWLVNPLGVNILLYGFQSALYKAGSHSLSH